MKPLGERWGILCKSILTSICSVVFSVVFSHHPFGMNHTVGMTFGMNHPCSSWGMILERKLKRALRESSLRREGSPSNIGTWLHMISKWIMMFLIWILQLAQEVVILLRFRCNIGGMIGSDLFNIGIITSSSLVT
jgi:hypothetical protein